MTTNPLSDPLNRQNTFSRAATFQGSESFRAATTTIFGRSVTDQIGITYTSEEQWTKSLIGEYVRIADKGVDGDMPPPLGFGREKRFWRMMFFAGLIGCVMGIVGSVFLNLADEPPTYWSNNIGGNPDTPPSKFRYNQGQIHWIAITTVGGFTVGLLRFIMSFPENISGIFKEINTYHVDHTIAPQAILLSTISLASGANLGPEQALATLGGGFAGYILTYFPSLDFDKEDRNLLVLTGMTAAVGALFPSPILSVMMMYELGKPPRTNMESVTILSFAALASFACYFAIVGTGKTWIKTITPDGIYLAGQWEYDNWQLLSGFCIGVVSAAIQVLTLIMIGASKQIFGRIRKRLERNKFLQAVVPPSIAGVVIGGFNYFLPLTIGHGNLFLGTMIKLGYEHEISTNLLLSTGFARMLTLGLSMNCVGYIGGFIFPQITIATIAGIVCYRYFSYLPYGMCIGCFIAGIPSGICPMPFTMSCLAIFMFNFGLYQTAPILVSTITSYTLVCGSGLVAALQTRVRAAEAAAAAEAKGEPVVDSSVQQVALATRVHEDTLSLAKYLNAKPSQQSDDPL